MVSSSPRKTLWATASAPVSTVVDAGPWQEDTRVASPTDASLCLGGDTVTWSRAISVTYSPCRSGVARGRRGYGRRIWRHTALHFADTAAADGPSTFPQTPLFPAKRGSLTRHMVCARRPGMWVGVGIPPLHTSCAHTEDTGTVPPGCTTSAPAPRVPSTVLQARQYGALLPCPFLHTPFQRNHPGTEAPGNTAGAPSAWHGRREGWRQCLHGPWCCQSCHVCLDKQARTMRWSAEDGPFRD